MKVRIGLAFLCASLVASGADAAACKKLAAIGLTTDQQLVAFRTCKPRKLETIGPITGLGGADSSLIGIDYRVQGGALYGVGNGGGVYVLDEATGLASFVSQIGEPITPGVAYDIDFNPVANRLRIVNEQGQNLRHDVTLATGGTTPDAALSATGVAGAAYTNNDLTGDPPNTNTTLFDLNASTNEIQIQSPPNNGNLVATGQLGADPGTEVGFDIWSELDGAGRSVANFAFASLVVDGVPGFYRVDPLTGRAVLLGALPTPLLDFALPLEQ